MIEKRVGGFPPPTSRLKCTVPFLCFSSMDNVVWDDGLGAGARGTNGFQRGGVGFRGRAIHWGFKRQTDPPTFNRWSWDEAAQPPAVYCSPMAFEAQAQPRRSGRQHDLASKKRGNPFWVPLRRIPPTMLSLTATWAVSTEQTCATDAATPSSPPPPRAANPSYPTCRGHGQPHRRSSSALSHFFRPVARTRHLTSSLPLFSSQPLPGASTRRRLAFAASTARVTARRSGKSSRRWR